MQKNLSTDEDYKIASAAFMQQRFRLGIKLLEDIGSGND